MTYSAPYSICNVCNCYYRKKVPTERRNNLISNLKVMCFLWLVECGQSKSTHGEPVSREGDKPARADSIPDN